MRLLLLLLVLISLPVTAQELPPPGGWPLRPVSALQVVAEPPGGLLPYRQGRRWGFADTTGRVWIQPIFTTEPPRFGAGLLLVPRAALASSAPAAAPRHRQRSHYRSHRGQQMLVQRRHSQPDFYPPTWNARYGALLRESDADSLRWYLGHTGSLPQPVWLLNARGEQLRAEPGQALVPGPDGTWRAESRAAGLPGRRELVAIEPAATPLFRPLPAAPPPGRAFTVPLAPQPPLIPPRLLRQRRYDYDPGFAAAANHRAAAQRYVAQQVNWLRPARLVAGGHDGIYRLAEDTRYRHRGRQALFDARGRRLTGYRYAGARVLLPRRLAYWHWVDSTYYDEHAVDSSGVPQWWRINEETNGPARRYGLLDLQGREVTPPLFVRLEVVGPNSFWVVAVRCGRLHYGLIDTLGRYHLPLSPRPLSLPDAAGLLRRRSTAPTPYPEPHYLDAKEATYPDTATVQYLRPDGRPAFPGRFSGADAFWQGRALVRQGNQYGLLDTLGRWVLPPQPARLSYFAYTAAHHEQWEATDPLDLFDHFDGQTRYRGSYRNTLPGAPLLLLTYAPRQGYGLRDARTGLVLVPAEFDQWPQQWYGGVVGQRQGQPRGYSYAGQAFDPDAPASYPPGVQRPTAAPVVYRELLRRTQQGWLTRGGRQLWQD